MRAALLEDVGNIRLTDMPRPSCPKDGFILKVGACAVCATDVKMYRFGHHMLKLPRVLGHEVAGTIDEAGARCTQFKVGDRIAVAAVICCGTCSWCLKGVSSMCEDHEAFGYHYDGGFAQYMMVPAKSIRSGGVNPLADHVTFEEAAIAEPLACVLNGQKISPVSLGDAVVVIGAGPLGIMHAELAARRGAARVFMIDIDGARLEQAEPAGADSYINSSKEDAVEKVMELTDGRGADVVMVACGAAAAQKQALDMVARCGWVNLFGGLPKGKSLVELDTNIIHYKQCRVVGTHGSSMLDNREAIETVAAGVIDVKKLITHRVGLDALPDELDNAGSPGRIKVVVLPNG